MKIDMLKVWWEIWQQNIEKMDTTTLRRVHAMMTFNSSTRKKLIKMMRSELQKRGELKSGEESN